MGNKVIKFPTNIDIENIDKPEEPIFYCTKSVYNSNLLTYFLLGVSLSFGVIAIVLWFMSEFFG
jgi:hypothetical protein